MCCDVVGQVKRIGILPDDILLEIFHFYVDVKRQLYEGKARVEEWQLLVHVCRQWRSIVFRSPRRLNLRLYCTPKTPAKDTLDIWPAFPLMVFGDMKPSSGTDNIIAALEQRNRVSQVWLTNLANWQLENVLATMQAPFLELEGLRLTSVDETPPVIPDSFLGGSAPRLQFFVLSRISFPGLPKLLLTASHLTYLSLIDIPHSGYISPEAIVAPSSVLSNLEYLRLSFQSPRSRPGGRLRSSQSPKLSIFPALRYFQFKGVTEYLEELVIRIGTPQLNNMKITFFNQIDFNIPGLAQFINRTPRLRALDEVHVHVVVPGIASIRFQYRPSGYHRFGHLLINISCSEPDWQLSSIEQVCNSFHFLSTVEHLYIERQAGALPVWKDDPIENTLWFQLLLPFAVVKNLYLSMEFVPRIAATLKELVTSRVTEILPSLQNIFVEGLGTSGPLRENIEQFVATRHLSDNPIAISDWDQGHDWNA